MPLEDFGCFYYVTVIYFMCIQGLDEIEETEELASIRHGLTISKINFKAEKELTQHSVKWDQLSYENHREVFGQIFKVY